MTNDILFAETELLKYCGFDLEMESPYQYLDAFFEKNKEYGIMQIIAKNLLNDSFRLNICLFYEPVILALAAVNSAAKLVQHTMAEHWFASMGDIKMQDIDEASLQLQDYFKL